VGRLSAGKKLPRAACAVLTLLGALEAAGADWVQVGAGKDSGISGLALLSRKDGAMEFLVVHDNKGAAGPRLGVVTVESGDVRHRALEWPHGKVLPDDLEAISAVACRPGEFLAVTSTGDVRRISVKGETVSELSRFELRGLPRDPNVEGLGAQTLGGRTVLVWGERGSGEVRGTLYWGVLDKAGDAVTDVSSAKVRVFYPDPSDPDTRHISDLRLDEQGAVWSAAAHDPNDNGPFDSALYRLGVLRVADRGEVAFDPERDLTPLRTFAGRKVEAIEILPGPAGGMAFGSDDENCGGWILLDGPAAAEGAGGQGGALTRARRGLRAVERSLEAHGGRAAFDALRLSITVRGDLVNEGQSVRAEAPFETYPARIEVALDAPARRTRVEQRSSIAGGFVFTDVTDLRDGEGFSLTPELRTYREVASEPAVLGRLLPHRVFLLALENRASIRWIGEGGGEEIVSFAAENGRISQLRLDAATDLLRAEDQVLPLGAWGDGRRELIYEGYRRVADVQLPASLRIRTHSSVHGVVESSYRYEAATSDVRLDPGPPEVPEGYARADYSYRGAFAVRELAEDVYLLENVTSSTRQWSYNVLVVVLDEFVLVGEAPVGSGISEAVLAKIRELAPGKPVRYLVQSHHHGDHLGGIRAYVAEGTIILAGASAAPLIEKIAAAPFDLDPDRLHGAPRRPVVEVVEGSRTIRDARHEVVVHNLGPGPHAQEMLVVHLPRERILYQADLVNDGEYPENETTRDFFVKAAGLGLEFDVLAGLHGRIRRGAGARPGGAAPPR
jgi:glyoxylase-like metal-dependent hydrolase (beta-lactamase superfamily II)